MNPDFRHFQGTTYIAHSAKGSTWKKHKYLKKIGDRYVYAKEQVGKAVSDIGKKIDNTTLWENKRTASVEGVSGSTTTTTKTKVKDVRREIGKSTSNTAKKGMDAISKILNNAKKSWNTMDNRRLEKKTQQRKDELIRYRAKERAKRDERRTGNTGTTQRKAKIKIKR